MIPPQTNHVSMRRRRPCAAVRLLRMGCTQDSNRARHIMRPLLRGVFQICACSAPGGAERRDTFYLHVWNIQ